MGNTDNHIKNISLLYSKNLKGIQLAPAYDIASTAVYENSTRDMAMAIGNKIRLDDIGRNEFAEAAGKVGLNPKMAIKRLGQISEGFVPAMRKCALQLTEEGFYKANELCERILSNGGIKRI